jgi:hypothetical protein
MQIIVDINREAIIKKLALFLNTVVSFLYQWLSTDGEVLGYILGTIHIILSIFILVCVFVSHTVYPVFWFQCVVFIWLFLIWIQHVVLKVCVVIVAEKGLTQKHSPYYEIMGEFLHKFFNIELSDFVSYVLVAETVAVSCFGLEIVSVISAHLQLLYLTGAFGKPPIR